jgi:hypothetical protein
MTPAPKSQQFPSTKKENKMSNTQSTNRTDSAPPERLPEAASTEGVAELFNGNRAANRLNWWSRRFNAFVPGDVRGINVLVIA